ncbi:hypothetical protein ROZALSC1DRAFT_27075 [Rozella allomycis CSF55]|uniref:Uncharacterized protein n=1 Tax=Rozella allomycis (strain CSF55) TaxID=988480 RepID=A0A075AZC3_ROZAC|nr:hypothetical protein O9G_002648 [Rozella allomycis CSF55]RKP21539.1 hypothetical protein ROZALSC1DRAFT_27075 [Rozella allomycis CSF55]|eukprot:EPZ35640.1 hypothetical protein O9G_002648 [Rozella allomycis CSF55]
MHMTKTRRSVKKLVESTRMPSNYSNNTSKYMNCDKLTIEQEYLNTQLQEQLYAAKEAISRLQRENLDLKKRLKTHGIETVVFSPKNCMLKGLQPGELDASEENRIDAFYKSAAAVLDPKYSPFTWTRNLPPRCASTVSCPELSDFAIKNAMRLRKDPFLSIEEREITDTRRNSNDSSYSSHFDCEAFDASLFDSASLTSEFDYSVHESHENP